MLYHKRSNYITHCNIRTAEYRLHKENEEKSPKDVPVDWLVDGVLMVQEPGLARHRVTRLGTGPTVAMPAPEVYPHMELG